MPNRYEITVEETPLFVGKTSLAEDIGESVLEFTYTPGSKGRPIEPGHPLREPDEGPDVEFIRVVSIAGIPCPPDLAGYILDWANNEDWLKDKAIEEAQDE